SGTRKEELLLSPEILRKIWILRRMVSSLGEEEGLNTIMEKLRTTSDNEEFLDLIDMHKNRY
ncbi:MAG TPA: transcription termination factor Rho, partial [Kosmotoga arenicorallina]|nr:transcription termination factor Rho [Kosmotoga arenicorallina]